MKLPEKFNDNMKIILKENYDKYIDSLDNDTYRGIRVNTLKISVEEFLKITDFDLESIPWTKDGFYIKSDLRPSKHPHYFAGLYYIQEPSAMLPAVLLNPNSGDITLDLCAAPGGKTMQLAALMEDKGLLVANDINNNRIKAIIRNCELLGLKNIIVLNEKQENISEVLKSKFDKILVDAPCSGEGMFKKHDGAIDAYEEYSVESCVLMQESILDKIPAMLNGKGEIVYSTCTFNRHENEEMIEKLLENEELSIEKLDNKYNFSNGIDLDGPLRLFPHEIKGEGHFVAKVISDKEKELVTVDSSNNNPPDLLLEFMKENLNNIIEGYFKIIKDKVFLLPEKRLDMRNLKVSKRGWYLGELKKNRFVPSHAFALGLKVENYKNVINLDKKDINISKYLKCETLKIDGKKGYNLICVDNYPIGWGKWANGTLKNLYPAAWRIKEELV